MKTILTKKLSKMKKQKIDHKKKQTPIHVRLEYHEALSSKRDILSTEMNLINISQSMRRYKNLRIQELKIKLRIHRKIKEILTEINKLHKILPEIRVPQFLIETSEKTLQSIEIGPTKTNDLESQLRDIQEKLRTLQRK